MSTKELERLEVVRRVAEGRLTQAKAGEFIGLSEHQVRRLRVAFESARRSTRGTTSKSAIGSCRSGGEAQCGDAHRVFHDQPAQRSRVARSRLAGRSRG